MKIFIPITLIMFLCITMLTAQIKVGYGVKAGLNVANQKTTGAGENVNTSSLLGVHIGAFTHVFLLKPLALQGELLFSQKGSKWSDPYFSGKDRLSYIDIPVLVRVQIIDFLNIHAGPQFGFLLGAKQIYDDGDKTDVKEYYKGTDIGLVLGAEGNLPYNINITIRYILGLSTVNSDIEYWEEWKNNVLQISFGYILNGQKD